MRYIPIMMLAVGLGAAGAADRQGEIKALSNKIMERITVLSETPPAKKAQQDKVLKALRSADAQLKTVVPDKKLKTAGQRIGSLTQKSHEGETKGNLGALRGKLAIFYGEHEGSYPKKLDELLDAGMPRFSAVRIADHPESDEVQEYGDEACAIDKINGSKLKDTGKWGYVTDTKSTCWGAVFVDCTHKDSKGAYWYKY